MLLLTVVLLLVVSVFLFAGAPRRTAPGPPIVPLFGTALSNPPWRMPHEYKDFQQLFITYGPVVQLVRPLTMMSIYVISDPQLARQIMTEKEVFDGRSPKSPLRHIFPTGLLGAQDGERWKVHRRIMTAPLFNKEYIQQYMKTISSCIDVFIKIVGDKVALGPQDIDVSPKLKMLALDAIARLAFGFEGDLQNENSSHQASILKSSDRSLVAGAFAKDYFPNCLWNLTGLKKSFDKTVGYLHGLVDEVIENGKGADASIISVLKAATDPESSAKFSADELKDEALSILLAGHETTANTLNWTVYLLSLPENKPILEKLVAEIDEVLGGRSLLTLEDIDKLEYSQSTIMESLRLFPTLPFVPRFCKTNYKLGSFEILSKVTMDHFVVFC
jgi:cytochrome P450